MASIRFEDGKVVGMLRKNEKSSILLLITIYIDNQKGYQLVQYPLNLSSVQESMKPQNMRPIHPREIWGEEWEKDGDVIKILNLGEESLEASMLFKLSLKEGEFGEMALEIHRLML